MNRKLLAPVAVVAISVGVLSLPSYSGAASSKLLRVPRALAPITVGVQAPVALFTPFYMIQANPKLCAPYGVDPTFATVNPVSGPPALLGGSVPLQAESNGSFFEEAAKSPSSITLLGGYGPSADYYWVSKNVTSLKDLAGKTVAVTTPGGSSDLVARVVIKLAGLKAGTGPREVHVDYVGSTQAQVALTTTGQTAGFNAVPPLPPAATAAGVHSIANLTFNPQAIPPDTLAVVVSGPYFRAHKSTVHGMLQCIAHANVTAKANPAAAESALESSLNESPALAAQAYDGNKATWNIFPFTKSLAAAALKDVQAAGLAAQVVGYSSKSDDTTALTGIAGSLKAPPGTSLFNK